MNTGESAARRAKVTPLPRPHPTPATFVRVGVILAFITAAEFLILYVRGMSALVVTILAALSAAKFFLVAAYFMHLRFDPRLLTAIFAVGVTLATLITIAVRFISLA
ncbi:cytochrome C oxidase subunit IV family protein [Symbiobacterium thermophilum]|uniref:cytochrome C oxidase subunit IV family protein n=1 Tax=Symbiobacterium thermophilum TaxID=2734 RepID=UPI002356DAE5|nr:cytochrome C oxidase subunit IV family protein [Symbiobacterium thermophilum]